MSVKLIPLTHNDVAGIQYIIEVSPTASHAVWGTTTKYICITDTTILYEFNHATRCSMDKHLSQLGVPDLHSILCYQNGGKWFGLVASGAIYNEAREYVEAGIPPETIFKLLLTLR